MNDFEKRTREAADKNITGSDSFVESFVAGAKWAHAEMHAKAYEQANTIQSMYENIERLKAENEKLRKALKEILEEDERFAEEAVQDWDGVMSIAKYALALPLVTVKSEIPDEQGKD